MEALTPWLTPALIVALFAGLRKDISAVRTDISAVNKRIDHLSDETNKRFDEVNKRFDHVGREFGDLRERMARLEGALEGFLAGRRDRDAA